VVDGDVDGAADRPLDAQARPAAAGEVVDDQLVEQPRRRPGDAPLALFDSGTHFYCPTFT
jgi:hypothetical protein